MESSGPTAAEYNAKADEMVELWRKQYRDMRYSMESVDFVLGAVKMEDPVLYYVVRSRLERERCDL